MNIIKLALAPGFLLLAGCVTYPYQTAFDTCDAEAGACYRYCEEVAYTDGEYAACHADCEVGANACFANAYERYSYSAYDDPYYSSPSWPWYGRYGAWGPSRGYYFDYSYRSGSGRYGYPRDRNRHRGRNGDRNRDRDHDERSDGRPPADGSQPPMRRRYAPPLSKDDAPQRTAPVQPAPRQTAPPAQPAPQVAPQPAPSQSSPPAPRQSSPSPRRRTAPPVTRRDRSTPREAQREDQ